MILNGCTMTSPNMAMEPAFCKPTTQKSALTCFSSPPAGLRVASADRFSWGAYKEGTLQSLRKVSIVPSFHESGSSYFSVDEARTLKNKAEEVVPHLNERCIYLVGMMGSGKTNVGKKISQVLGYSFFDSDKLVEEAVGATSVAQIFEDYSESFFRDNEA